LPLPEAAFGANGERQVSTTRSVWFRNGGRAEKRPDCPRWRRINGKFTPNQIEGVFDKISAI